jgi:hypothetical protein
METLYRVNFRKDGRWEVFKKGNQRATRVFDTQDEAIEFATEITNQTDLQETVVEIANKDETIGYAKEITSEENKVEVDEIVDTPTPPIEEIKDLEEVIETPQTSTPPVQLETDVQTNPTITSQPKKKKGFFSRLFGRR